MFIAKLLSTINKQLTIQYPTRCVAYLGTLSFGPPLPMFDSNCTKLPHLDDTQIGWWDECHIEQQGGKVGNKMVQYSFKRDKQGNLCPNGTYNNKLLTKTAYKYPEQGRFSFGVAKVRKVESNKDEGVRMECIDYTNREHMHNRCIHKTYERRMGSCAQTYRINIDVGSKWPTARRTVGE